MPLWPKLKKKDRETTHKKTKKKKQSVNSFACQGVEEFSFLMAELQAKKPSEVGETGNLVSAARYLSRSSQELTETSLKGTASRCRESSPEASVLLLSNPHSQERVESGSVDFSQSFSLPYPRYDAYESEEGKDWFCGSGIGSEASVVLDQQEENSESSSVTDAETSETRRNSCENREVEVGVGGSVRISGSLSFQEWSEGHSRNGLLLFLKTGFTRSPSSAPVLLVALGSYLRGLVTMIGHCFSKLLAISVVIRWQNGKYYVELFLSLVTQLVIHLSIRAPRGLTLPLLTRSTSLETLDGICTCSEAQTVKLSESEAKGEHGQSTSPSAVTLESSFLSSPSSECQALAVLLPEPAARSRSTLPLSRVSTSFPIHSSSTVTCTSTPTQRFVKKLSSKPKPKISRSSTSESNYCMPSYPSSPRSESTMLEDLSPRGHSKISFSSRNKPVERLKDSNGRVSSEVLSEGSSSSKRECIMTKKCSSVNEYTTESSIKKTKAIRKSPLGNDHSAQSIEPTPIVGITSVTPWTVIDTTTKKSFDLWLTVGLFVALTFLFVSRFSAIAATSLLFLVLSHAQRDGSYHAWKMQRTPAFGRLG